LWQEEIEKRRDMARLQISSNDQKGLTQAKPGGATHSSRRTVTKIEQVCFVLKLLFSSTGAKMPP
ncbi:MAG: hypothetical protein WBG50_04800, partial [Desulfomonilaceae bacterium]